MIKEAAGGDGGERRYYLSAPYGLSHTPGYTYDSAAGIYQHTNTHTLTHTEQTHSCTHTHTHTHRTCHTEPLQDFDV